MADNQDRRAYARWVIGEEGVLRLADRDVTCRVVNVSAGGMLLHVAEDVDEGAEVEMRLSGLPPIRARVVRAGGDRLAAVFVGGPQYVFR